ncbi:carboxymuconolactone decarboxylase family protein [Halobacillus sp. ACCC02827]|uniref:carboxymuconolactone decarboxylase family protein n=1 Tax=unclassified Halobacillus TaxID=2636472 RepID=UPI0007848C58|nr:MULTISPECIES: carboxymuconolactone decarboxylase family protein [unclassified Halobacillus]WJE17224.1 carboxymuconolactone decarboxylase family protein [Halobacillus sp. ACCC02827]
MPRINFASEGTTPFERLLGHQPAAMKAWSSLGTCLMEEGKLSAALKEQVRRVLAQKNGCEYCKAKGKPDPSEYDERTAVAAGFAEVFTVYRGMVPDSLFQVLRDVFNDAEISELCAYICFTTASQYMGAVLGLEAEKSAKSG